MVVSIFMASVTTRGWPFFTLSPLFTRTVTTEPESCCYVTGVIGICFLADDGLLVDILVDHVDFPFRTVEHESNGPHAPIIGIAYVDEFDDGLHAFIQSDRDFFVFVMPKKKVGVSRTLTSPYFLMNSS